MTKSFYVYILTNTSNTTLYVGMTNNLIRRVFEHKNSLVNGFTKKYGLHKLIYFENLNNALNAIEREKQLKRWHREWKFNLIKSINPNLDDLYKSLIV